MSAYRVVGQRRSSAAWGSMAWLYATRPLRRVVWRVRDWRSDRRYQRLARRYDSLDDGTLLRLVAYASALRIEARGRSLYRDTRELRRHQDAAQSMSALASVLRRRIMRGGGPPRSLLERTAAALSGGSVLKSVVEPTLADLRFEQLELRRRGHFRQAEWVEVTYAWHLIRALFRWITW